MNGSGDFYYYRPPAQVSHFGSQGWTSLGHGASTAQMSQQRPSIQQPQYPPQRMLASSSQAQSPFGLGASASRPQTNWPSGQMQNGTNSDRNLQISRLAQGLELLREQIEVLARADLGSPKKDEKKKKQKESFQCQHCHHFYASQTTLSRHYKAIHNVFDLEQFEHTESDTVLTPEDTPQRHRCGICGYVTFDRNTFDSHNYFVHRNDVYKCKLCEYKANSKIDFDNHVKVHNSVNANGNNGNVGGNNGNVSSNNGNVDGNNGYVSGNHGNVSGNIGNANGNDGNVSGNHGNVSANIRNPNNNNGNVRGNNATANSNDNNTNNILEAVSRMHKCEDCECYFADEIKLNNHMKVMHKFEVLCKICNKNLFYKNIDHHVKYCHPDLCTEFAEKRGNVVENTRPTKTVKYNQRFGSKLKTWRRGSIYKRKLRRYVKSNAPDIQVNVRVNGEDTQTDKDIMYVCEACDIATAAYDVVVEHSQKHIADPNIQFTVVNCDTCQLKFEPICYERHLDLHYTKKDVTKEYFKYLKYKYHLLFTNEWPNFFNMEKDVVDKIVSGSMYAATRAVKMRVVANSLAFTNTLYQCRQCDNFIRAATVLHHALNFDTCVRIRNSFPCDVCDRSFNTKTACDNHEAMHTDDETFRTVVFNTDDDREFNYKLNNNEVTELKTEATATDENEAILNVMYLYKCLCDLCFVSVDSANRHLENCSGSDEKLTCKICNYLFNQHELINHFYEHHLDENIFLVVIDAVPNVIEISDDECKNDAGGIEILSSDYANENDDLNETQDTNDIIKVQVTEPRPSGSDAVQGQTVIENIETTRVIPMDEDDGHIEQTGDENPGRNDSDGVSDDKTPHSTTNVASIDEKKSAETCLLNITEEEMHLHESNNISATNLDIAIVKTEASTIEVKEEIPWYLDNDVYIDWRSEGQTNAASTDDVIFNLDDLLTDDEDEEMTPINEQTDAQNNTNHINEVQASTEEIASDGNTMEYDVQNNLNTTEEIDDNTRNHGIIDVYRPNFNASFDLVFSERRIVLNTSSISTENGNQIIELITWIGQSEHGYEDTEYEQMRRNVLRNIENNIVKYFERRLELSGQQGLAGLARQAARRYVRKIVYSNRCIARR